jgi:membrane fusion protein, multidrug efflux system
MSFSATPGGGTPKQSSPAAPTSPPHHPGLSAEPPGSSHPVAAPSHSEAATPSPPWRKWVGLGAAVVGLGAAAFFLIPWIVIALNTVSTDDAYVNCHVTFVAARVPGQVSKVLVDNNYRVKKGDLLVQLDKVPYQVQVAIKKAAVTAAERDLVAAEALVRGNAAQARSNRYKLEHTMEDVNNQIANLRANVATLNSRKATLEQDRAKFKRGEELAPSGGISKEDLDVRRQTVKVDEALVEQALQIVYSNRVSLGLPAEPPKGKDLADVPANLDQNFSSVRQALGDLVRSATQLGYFPTTWDAAPKEAIEAFFQQDAKANLTAFLVSAAGQAGGLQQNPWQVGWTAKTIIETGNLDLIYAHLIREAPAVKQAEAKLLQAQRDLDQAELNLSYCDVVSEIDGVVTSRNVNPGNNVQAGQSLLAVRSLTEIWIDANFKETQLADLRIGQRVRCEVDMYGGRREYEGRITGFTMGTGQTLALLPPQNATGNFVKIVQRLPVRIELTDYDPDKAPLFAGLSVTPYVYYKEPPEGPNAGKFLQPNAPLPRGPVISH